AQRGDPLDRPGACARLALRRRLRQRAFHRLRIEGGRGHRCRGARAADRAEEEGLRRRREDAIAPRRWHLAAALRAIAQGETTMQRDHLEFGKGFRVSIGNERSQAAQMTIAPGGQEGGSDNRHRRADQWLYVVSGNGLAIVNAERLRTAGFADVTVSGIGDKRAAEAAWPGPDNTGEMPAQVTEVVEI